MTAAACGSDKAVGPTPLATISITPTSLSLKVSESQTLTAKVTDAKGATVTGRLVTWSIADQTVAQVNPAGAVTALAPGQTTVTATAEGKMATAAVTVLSPARIMLTISSPKVLVGDTAVITWNASDASSCTASGAWTGTQPVNGTHRITPTDGGVKSFALRCDGAGGVAQDSVRLIVPMPVKPTSYENVQDVVLPDTRFPYPQHFGLTEYFQGGSGAYADFVQDGRYSLLVSLTPAPTWSNGVPVVGASRLVLFEQGAFGGWIRSTKKVFDDESSCISPRKALVADFNGDQRPDVFIACYGPDEDLTKSLRIMGENSRVLLSNPDGSYTNRELSFWGAAHGAAAGDIDGDGNVDLVITQTMRMGNASSANAVTDVLPYVLLGDGRGNFTLDLARMPTERFHLRGIFNFELIDAWGSGNLDLVYQGSPPEATGHDTWWRENGAIPNGIIRNDGTGRFTGEPFFFRNVQSPAGIFYDVGLDVVVRDRSAYILQVDKFYTAMAITRVDLITGLATMLYERRTAFSVGGPYVTWLYAHPNGSLVARELNCPPNVVDSRCALQVPWR
jgi:hypothetical protein